MQFKLSFNTIKLKCRKDFCTMSKLLDMYTSLKKEDSETLYLFKVGLFYNFLNNDAVTVSNLTNLKMRI